MPASVCYSVSDDLLPCPHNLFLASEHLVQTSEQKKCPFSFVSDLLFDNNSVPCDPTYVEVDEDLTTATLSLDFDACNDTRVKDSATMLLSQRILHAQSRNWDPARFFQCWANCIVSARDFLPSVGIEIAMLPLHCRGGFIGEDRHTDVPTFDRESKCLVI
jgi:hypothetical protein